MIPSLFKLFPTMLIEELLRKVRCVWGDNSWSIFIVDFKSFRLTKVYERFGVKKVKKRVFYVVELNISGNKYVGS